MNNFSGTKCIRIYYVMARTSQTRRTIKVKKDPEGETDQTGQPQTEAEAGNFRS